MKKTAQNFYSLRVYRNLSTSAIFNLMLCNRLMKLKPLVSNASKIYKYSNRIFGSSITNFALNQTFCKALTAGNTLTDANLVSNKFRNDGKIFFNIRHPYYFRLLCRRRNWNCWSINYVRLKCQNVCQVR